MNIFRNIQHALRITTEYRNFKLVGLYKNFTKDINTS